MPKEQPVQALAFDVYGTLVDPLRMEDHLRLAFGDSAKEAAELWRAKQVEYSFRRALMKRYENFDVCTAQALHFVSTQMGVSLSEEALRKLLDQYLKLPAYADVPAALAQLKERGFDLVACSNGTHNAVRNLLEQAGILSRFSEIVSVDSLRTFKPDPAVYEYLVAHLESEKERVWLVSSNPFDVIGAKACGLRAVWVRRDSRKVYDPWEFQPDLIVQNLEELPSKLNFT